MDSRASSRATVSPEVTSTSSGLQTTPRLSISPAMRRRSAAWPGGGISSAIDRLALLASVAVHLLSSTCGVRSPCNTAELNERPVLLVA